MTDFWKATGDIEALGADEEWPAAGTDRSVRKEQITIRLDPGMIADARTIAARKGIGHHTLLRMWVMEGIVRAYEDGLLDGPPQSWTPPARRAVAAPRALEVADAAVLPPSGARWTRTGQRR